MVQTLLFWYLIFIFPPFRQSQSGKMLQGSQRNGLSGRHRGTHLNTHLPAASGKIFCRQVIRAAKHQLDIAVADDSSPQVIAIAVL